MFWLENILYTVTSQSKIKNNNSCNVLLTSCFKFLTVLKDKHSGTKCWIEILIDLLIIYRFSELIKYAFFN